MNDIYKKKRQEIMKKVIKLTENDLHRIIINALNEAYNEFGDGDFASDGDPYGLAQDEEPEGKAYWFNNFSVETTPNGAISVIDVHPHGENWTDEIPVQVDDSKVILAETEKLQQRYGDFRTSLRIAVTNFLNRYYSNEKGN